jgi:hypothetical protein
MTQPRTPQLGGLALVGWLAHFEPHRLAGPRSSRQNTPPGRKAVNDPQASTAVILIVVALAWQGNRGPGVRDLDTHNPCRMRDGDGYRSVAMEDRVGDDLAGCQDGVIDDALGQGCQVGAEAVPYGTYRLGHRGQRP